MAKIIYKNGCEGQNRLECIEGIEINLLNGQKALIYPKYSEEIILPKEDIERYEQKYDTEISALKEIYGNLVTAKLLTYDSPAAKFVVRFHVDKNGTFTLPTLLAAMEIQHQKKDIDALAETINGADLLKDFTCDTWSCFRCAKKFGWIAYGDTGTIGYTELYDALLVIPTILY